MRSVGDTSEMTSRVKQRVCPPARSTTARRIPWTLVLSLWALWMLLARVPSRATSSLPSLRRSRAMASVTHVPAHTLFVSEPPPEWFGNGPNPQNGRGWSNKNWVRRAALVECVVEHALPCQHSLASQALLPQLKSKFHTNFAEFSHGRPSIGVMRVCNDDLVQPARGFGTHPHRDAEIATYIVQAKVKVNTDVNLHASRITPGRTLDFELGAGRQAYVLSLENGAVMDAGGSELRLEQHDAALVTGPTQLRFTAPPGGPGAHVLLIEMAAA